MKSDSDGIHGNRVAVESGTEAFGLVAEDLAAGYGRGGRNQGLHGFSATFRPGITGLIGPNGAGKTTFFRVVAGTLRLAGGRLRMRGQEPSEYRARHGIGFLPENPPLPDYLTVGEFLSGLPTALPVRVDEGLPEFPEFLSASMVSRRVSSLSLGQRRKVALAAALAGDPEILLLDEPTNGLDPSAVRGLRAVLTEQRKNGVIILLSSHHLDELQRVADSLVFVHGGRALGSWTREEALERYSSMEGLFHAHFQGGPP